MRVPIIPLAAAVLASLALAACGSSSPKTTSTPSTGTTTSSSSATTTPTTSSTSSTSGATAQSLSLEANPSGELKYNKTSLSANAGKVSIAFTNMAPLEHDVTIEGAGGKIIGATPKFTGGTQTLSLELKPGTYKFFCSVPGHRMAGMEGTLTIH